MSGVVGEPLRAMQKMRVCEGSRLAIPGRMHATMYPQVRLIFGDLGRQVRYECCGEQIGAVPFRRGRTISENVGEPIWSAQSVSHPAMLPR